MGFILGPLLETSARQSLTMSSEQFSIFFSIIVTAILLGLALTVLTTVVYSGIRKGKGNEGMEEIL